MRKRGASKRQANEPRHLRPAIVDLCTMQNRQFSPNSFCSEAAPNRARSRPSLSLGPISRRQPDPPAASGHSQSTFLLLCGVALQPGPGHRRVPLLWLDWHHAGRFWKLLSPLQLAVVSFLRTRLGLGPASHPRILQAAHVQGWKFQEHPANCLGPSMSPAACASQSRRPFQTCQPSQAWQLCHHARQTLMLFCSEPFAATEAPLLSLQIPRPASSGAPS